MSIKDIYIGNLNVDSQLEIKQYEHTEVPFEFILEIDDNLVTDSYIVDAYGDDFLKYIKFSPYINLKFKSSFCNNSPYLKKEGHFIKINNNTYKYEGKIIFDSKFHNSFEKCVYNLLNDQLYINLVGQVNFVNYNYVQLPEINIPIKYNFSQDFKFLKINVLENFEYFPPSYSAYRKYVVHNLDVDSKNTELLIITSENTNFNVDVSVTFYFELSEDKIYDTDQIDFKLNLNLVDKEKKGDFYYYTFNYNPKDLWELYDGKLPEVSQKVLVSFIVYDLNNRILERSLNSDLKFFNQESFWYIFVDKENPFKFYIENINKLNCIKDNCPINKESLGKGSLNLSGESVLPTNINSFLIENNFRPDKGDVISNINFVVENNVVNYNIEIKRKIKLFGIIPLPFSKKRILTTPY